MCQRCVEAVKHYWPDLPKEDYGTLLWSCTAFPFASPERTEEQIRIAAEKSGCDLGKAIALAEREMDEAMAQSRAESEP
jgi:hypothetical protein